ncbi:Do family serine endopeptidase [Tuwongella immobilis]|uniref:PDZ domain-containing protein n=1 Tax=Tuwongella immobilis TaxID=692036 RepID=A0A6C2YUF5_9BACT|nr:Do family serine endopeptidase [Tuwongella immobilis]VIP05074.1 protease do : Protease Do OS=Pirellula staleyi (strain ATCC 27377 / DSM 6068 / ICPB 4128) GN=Psta_1472 PE=4 SV=1: Trypsin_2: PDZ_2 [Tuwongella immobilis]VTS07504.1 protease do : Protease Do OS=Pirellula staleyi (strain ATCC 27377 / DSM 6068 / ICPB 4128) GN=Psta_1472 PE=4 SV=1: Trypsin_2: PDZ_2 [Tuwongella immobilis]
MIRRNWIPVAVSCLAVGVVGGVVLHDRVIGQAPPAVVLPAELTSYRDVVKRVVPAVVSIESRAKAVRMDDRADALPDGVPEEFRRFFGGTIPRGMPEAVPSSGFGSGFLIDPSGVILTNNHVVEGAESVEVTLADGRKFVSTEIKTDRKTDLAIVKISSKDALPFLEMGDSDQMEVGDRVLAVGAPFGLTGSVTHGIISAKSRDLRMNQYEDFLQTDAAINPGNSGGPLISLEGRVIGINSAIKSRSGGFQGIGLAIASNLAKTVKDQLLQNGTVKRGYLGVQVKDLTPELADRLGVNGNGVLIARVLEGGPAAKGGLQNGDVLMSIAGKPIRDGRDLQRTVATLKLNQPSKAIVQRDGQTIELSLTIEEQPEEFGLNVPANAVPRRADNAVTIGPMGMSVSALTPELAKNWGYTSELRGVAVVRVAPGSVAEEAGVSRGMVVTQVDKQSVTTPEEFQAALSKASTEKGALLEVRLPQGGVDFLVLKPRAE